jgi:predicted deacylase
VTVDDYVGMVFDELRRAERKFPGFPTDPVHAAAVLAEEVGELQQACLRWTYEGGSLEDVTKEAVQSAAMALRFLFNMGSLRRRPSEQEERVTGIAKHAQPVRSAHGKATSGMR